VPAHARRVVILYSHPLLGEGLARLLGGDRDLHVELVRVDGEPDAEAALASRTDADSPDVVVVERGLALEAMDLLRLAPTALLIDVGLDAGPSWAIRREQLAPQPDEILRTIRARRRTVGVRRHAPTAVPIEPSSEVPSRS
jgi:DNA-binding NarL/FixJ family response regulator